MEDVFKFGEESPEDALVITAKVNLGPFWINRGTSHDPELELIEGVSLDMESVSREVNLTVWEPPRHRVVFFDDLDDCVNYYRNSMNYYEEPEPIRVVGNIKEIDLTYKRAKIEINPKAAIFREPGDTDSEYVLFIRGRMEWKDDKIYYTRIYSYDLVLVDG